MICLEIGVQACEEEQGAQSDYMIGLAFRLCQEAVVLGSKNSLQATKISNFDIYQSLCQLTAEF